MGRAAAKVDHVTQAHALLHGEESDLFAHEQLHTLSGLSNLRMMCYRPQPGAKGQLRPDSGRRPETRHDNARAHTESGVQPGRHSASNPSATLTRKGEF